MNFESIYQKALNFEALTIDEGLLLYEHAPTPELMHIANELRKKKVPGNVVTWIIDRNVNTTNVCVAHCNFCNFRRDIGDKDTYTTTIKEYSEKIEEMLKQGGNQLLLQGGMHPRYGIKFYTDLFSELKRLYPEVKLHSLGPPEVAHIAKRSRLSFRDTLVQLRDSGLDSLPGAGAEILSDRVRRILSPGKCNTQEWLDVMREAHKLKMVTSATMMFGTIETNRERIEHLVQLREVQEERPEGSDGFTAFIPWPVMLDDTELYENIDVSPIEPMEYVRMIAISRIMLNNVTNIQASWLTVGRDTAQLCLHAGANDMGSIMIEENVVSAAGASYQMNAKGIQQSIIDAGFRPQLRTQGYEHAKLPEIVPELQPA
ncbi:cyclic dehypoxanthinyl futalosine synthase [Prolixibacter sp. SD074]|jgi:cyclic dehypoxanthinyl futalosine synthase|uniref:cyclic dehypoxanthinyl futalosine synthase n=1 Tax=Prolixibacter sp. SD074 TaxID=2652391 RepID=UPI001298F0E4|nr:cyclic dehypoxanthinyl futalosine synthase [Prolixibacter sp. SD074]